MSKIKKNEDATGTFEQLRFRRSAELDALRHTVLFPRKVERSRDLLAQVCWD